MSADGDRLSADDASILALESAAIAGHTLKLLRLAPAPQPLDLELLRAATDARLAPGSRGRERVEIAAGAAEDARWVADERFDIAAHVRRREGTAGLDAAGAWRVASAIMSERLDHTRPLWAIDLVGPLADGREAIVVRIHHAMADGISCVRFLAEVLWDEAAATPPAPTPGAGGRLAATPARPSRLQQAARLPGAIGRELGHLATRTLLDRRIGSARELAATSCRLADLKAIGSSRPGHVTVNDVLLAGVAGGLRGWLAAGAGRLPHLRAQVPVSLHHRDESATELGNRDSFLNVDLPLSEPDPLVRLDRINVETARRKQLDDAGELYDFFHALARCRPLGEVAQRIAAGPREFSLSISNVPGPRSALTVAGRQVEHLWSVAEPADRHALRISAISSAGTVGIGLCTDPEAVEGVAVLAGAIDDSLAELRRAAIG